jgi:8-oxo-dGTP diphosphatase
VLLLQRSSKETFFPGYYDLPGGKVDFGENPQEAVTRELREETGLIGFEKEIYNAWNWISNYRGTCTQFISISFFVQCLDMSNLRLEQEFENYVWASKKDLDIFEY